MEQDARDLFGRYADMIYRIAMSYGNSMPFAEDIVQEVFLRYLKKRPSFENDEHQKAWFIRVAVNCCKSSLSSAWFRRVCPLEEAGQIAVPFDSEEACELYEMLSCLPAKYRVVLYLRYYEEYQVKEIAGILGITPNLVSARLLRAKKMLKQELLRQNQKQEKEAFRDETGIV
ncbi:MAG: sigma-70 family RNA polymerase sigma factor [Lachnospiraceae bacterium]|nr:sigma-70 family RNA polymerase sigma factor [Lachnospiraceae bacterium]